MIYVSSSKHSITLLQNLLVVEFLTHFICFSFLNTEYGSFNPFTRNIFLSHSWNLVEKHVDIVQIYLGHNFQKPNICHLTYHSNLKVFGVFTQNFFCIFKQKNNHTPFLQLDCILLLILEKGQCCQSCEYGRCICVTTLIKTNSPHTWPIFEEETQFRRKGSIFPEPVEGIHKNGTKNEIVTKQNLQTTDQKEICRCLFAR